MEKAVPLLKPDLVLVGVLQADDLAQLYEKNFKMNKKSNNNYMSKGFEKIFKPYLSHSFKNILPLLSNKELRTVEIKSNWKASSASMINNFTHRQILRFNTLDDSVQSLFKSGDLNPSMIKSYVNVPDRLTIFNNPNHPATKFSIQKMNKDFQEMKAISSKNNSKLIFINLPSSDFTGHQVIQTPSSKFLGPYFVENNNIDPIYRSIANDNELAYMELTKHFISLKNKSEYFFKYDTHPNEKGYEEIAKYIGKQLIEKNKLKRKH